MLRRFLHQCGFSKKRVERFLKDLKENTHGTEIKLSRFFQRIPELGPPKGKIDKAVTIESSAIPHIESVLREAGLTPRHVDQILNTSRGKDGRLYLDRLELRLKELSHKGLPLQNRANLDQVVRALEQIKNDASRGEQPEPDNDKDLDRKAFKNHGRPGMEIPRKGRVEGGPAGRSHKGDSIPNDVKTTINQISERVITEAEKESPLPPYRPISKLSLPVMPHNMHRANQTDELGNPSLPLKEKDLFKAGDREQRGELSSRPFNTIRSHRSHGNSDLEANQTRPLLLPQDEIGAKQLHSSIQSLRQVFKKEGHTGHSEGNSTNIPRDISSSNLSDTIQMVTQNQKTDRNPFLFHLIDQVGKQISGSILRGVKVLKFHLYPPELGPLKIEMDMKDNVLKLGMLTENNLVKELFLSNAHELRDALVEQGIKLEKLDIQINYNSDHSFANWEEEPNDEEGWIQGFTGTMSMAEDDMDQSLSRHKDMGTGNYLLDLVA